MSNWKGTKEKVHISYDDREDESSNYFLFEPNEHETIEETKENAKLFTDALHTIQQCDLMPSQLLDENTKLKEALRNCM